jgi:tetratricopeptide (TPR) repeat protein
VEGRALVGRDRELGVLEALVRQALSGERSVLALTGEPGIGKTRMLEALAASTIAQGGKAAWGRMLEVGLTPPFWPFTQILNALETDDDRAPLLGGLAERADAAARLAHFAEVAAFLVRRAKATPIALLFDDLHVADPSSLQLLEYLLPLLVRERVIVALAARDTGSTPETAAALGRIQRSALRLPLARLEREAALLLVGDRADASRVFELSEGNPLFIEELVAAFQSDGVLRLPQLSSVREVIRDRVARLPQPTCQALIAAAVVGRDFRGQVVADMSGADDLGSTLKPALTLGMIAMTSPDRYRFSHALIAEAIADELDPSERARLHLQAAQALERREPTDTSAIAHHLLSAGHLSAAAAVHAAERAARQCMTQLAFEDAADLLKRALDALLLAAPDDRRHRALLLCERAEALQHATRHAKAAELCDEAAGIARALPSPESPELLARIALTRGLEFRFGRTDPVLVSMLREALDALGDGQVSLRAKLLARLAAAEQPALDPRDPVARALEAIELAAQLGPRDRLDVMYTATAALVDYVEPEALERIHREVETLARGTDRFIYVHTRLRLCFTALERVDRLAFDTAVQTFAAEAKALGLPRWTRQVQMLEAMRALLEGRFDDAERAAAQAEAISAAIGDAGDAWMMDVHRGMTAWVKTVPTDLALRARLAQYVPGRVALAAWYAMQDGSREQTRTALAELGDRVPVDPDLAAMVSSAVAFAGDVQLAARVYDRLESRRGRIVLAAMVGSAVMDLYDRLLLVLAAAAERWELIGVHAEQALAIAARLGSPVWRARVQADWAEALERRGRGNDAERAKELWAQALQQSERLGMPGLVARCRSALDKNKASSFGQPQAKASNTHLPADRIELTRSGELWIARGLGEQVHVKDSRGMQLLARLIEEAGRELHVLDLAGIARAVDGGDAGPLLDDKARMQYRARLRELMASRDEAEHWDDRARLERTNAEIEALTAEMERAVGLGGRDRRAGSASERARSNVQRRITHAIDQIRAASPCLGEHLEATVRTGTYCVYSPTKRA